MGFPRCHRGQGDFPAWKERGWGPRSPRRTAPNAPWGREAAVRELRTPPRPGEAATLASCTFQLKPHFGGVGWARVFCIGGIGGALWPPRSVEPLRTGGNGSERGWARVGRALGFARSTPPGATGPGVGRGSIPSAHSWDRDHWPRARGDRGSNRCSSEGAQPSGGWMFHTRVLSDPKTRQSRLLPKPKECRHSDPPLSCHGQTAQGEFLGTCGRPLQTPQRSGLWVLAHLLPPIPELPGGRPGCPVFLAEQGYLIWVAVCPWPVPRPLGERGLRAFQGGIFSSS